MNWESIAVIVALATFVASLFYNNWRDGKNKLLDIRMTYLIETYRLLSEASNRRDDEAHKYWSHMENAISDIQLLGTPEQISRIKEWVSVMTDQQSAPIDSVLNDLRDDLRKELRLPAVEGNLRWLRFHKKQDSPSS